jgi:hypothetical protein
MKTRNYTKNNISIEKTLDKKSGIRAKVSLFSVFGLPKWWNW